MKTDIRKKVSKIESEIQELNEKRVAVMIKEADAALEKLLKEHDADEVRLVKNPHESEDIESQTAPGIRFMQAGRSFRFTRFGLVNKIAHAKVQEIVTSGDDECFMPESDWTPLYMLKKDEDVDRSTLHIDETVEWLAGDEYAWEHNIYIPDMFADDNCDPFDMPYETPSVAECAVADTEESVEETAENSIEKNPDINNLDNTILTNISELTNERDAIDAEYAAKQQVLREKVIGFFVKTMEQNGIDELLLLPLTPNGYTIGSWDCDEEIDSDFESDLNDMVDCPMGTLIYGKEIETDCGKQIKMITRLGLKNGQLHFHTAIFNNYQDGDLSFGSLEQENWQSPWLPVTDYKDTKKLLLLLFTYLSHSGNWKFIKNHPECCFLNRKLDLEHIRQRIEEKIGDGDLSGLFENYHQLEEVDLSEFDASSVETARAMFYHCTNLTNINLTGIDTRNCESFESMFDGCESLKSVDVSNLNTASATTMQNMFRDCCALEVLDLSTFDTRNCGEISMMFANCKNLRELNLCNWNLTGLNGFGNFEMFSGCVSLSKIYLRNVDVDTFEAIKEAVDAAELKDVEIIAEIKE